MSSCHVKPRFCWNQGSNSSSSAGRFTCLFDRHSGGNCPSAEGRTAQNIKQQPATKSPRAFRAHKKTCLLGHAMGLFSAGFPTGVRVRLTLPHPTLRTGFPLPTRGRPHWPPGGSTAHLQLFKNSTSYSLVQIAKPADSMRRFATS